ncbi:MAG: L,D-transpeptidase, partial [Jatrophihabitans sp.]
MPTGLAAPPTARARPVHVSLFQGDGQTYGVGFAIIARFDVAPTDSQAFTRAVSVTVDGRPAGGAWFWQASGIGGGALEALYRPRSFWPAHAQIAAELPLKGLSAGPGLAYDDDLTLSVSTGAQHISTVDDTTHRMTVTSDGTVVRQMPVSLGAGDTPTYRGTKVVMAKGEDAPGGTQPRPGGEVRMVSNDPGDRYDLLVPWSVRITNSGEYVHAASWNTGNIGSRNTSHGCTNLDVADAQWFFQFSLVGDVVLYPNASGPTQPSW